MAGRPRYLLVDGHSIVFAWEELRRLHTRQQELARDRLIRSLTAYQDASGVKVVCVFDGRGKRPTSEPSHGGIQIIYSAGGQTADSVIERLAYNYAGTTELTVATGDRTEKDVAEGFGASWWSPETLRDEAERAGRELQQRLEQHRRTG